MSITYQESSYLKTKTGLHEFLMPEPRINDSREQIEWLQKKIMAFVCACANERTNGTIHIGADDKSKIIGMSGNKDAMKSAIEDAVSIHFFEDEASRIKKCITRIAFIPVTGNNADQFVLEVDVGPSFEYCEDVIFWYIEREGKMDVLRFVDGHPVVVPNEEIQILRKEIKSRAREQEQIEDQQRDSYLLNTTDDPVEKLKVLLSQKNVTRNMSPILVIDALPEKPTTEDMKSQFQFLKEWDWEYVFDFDSDETLYCYLDNEEQQVLSVLPVDDFNPEAKESSEYVNKQFTLSDSSRVWLYSNGSCSLDRKPQNVRDWKQRRGKQFREVVRLLKTQITNDRVVVVFMLFSTKLDVILEAADELITEFPNKWFAISETEDVMDAWKTGLCQKHLASQPMELLPVSVTGLRWADVNNVVRTFSKKIPCREISIPSEHGYVAVTEKTLNELTDLEIVSSLTYDVAALTEEKRHQFQVDSENAFYRGGQATWWNFCFNQVIDRNAVASLVEDIEKQMVEAVEDDRVAVVELHHQPGAGGTTVAKHVLWKLRDKCRCIVVRNITDQTVAQIEMVHRYKTDLPRPVLVLFDNKDEEAIDMLRFSLEERNSDAREWEFDSERHLFFVFLCTKRYSNIDSSQRHYLKQEMASNELHRFQERYTELTKKFKETSDPWLNPKHLISFNIMKENFSEEYIRTTVSSLVEDIEISKEIKLLAYTAMINTFDVYFQPLPLSAFDPLMRIPLDCSIGFFQSWEEYLTPSMNTLLTREYDSSETSSVHFRIIHGVVSKIIHDQLIKRNYKLMKDLFVEFIDSVVLDSRSRSTQRLVRIVCDVMKKRISNPKSGKPERFSPFIQCIISESENGKRNAEEILYNIFEISGDVFVGQQLARLYIFCGQWDKARITKDRGQERLKAALGLLQKNIESEACTLPDINRYLSVTIALCYIDRAFCKSTNGRSDFSKLAYSLYQNRSKIPYQNLEPYFFAAALNWPSGTCMDQCMTAGELRDLLENWRKAYNTESRSGNIQLLFLGRKQGMERYIFYDQLQVPRKRDLNESDQCVTKLEWFTGTLEYGGKTVLFQLADGENSSVTIKINTYRQGRNRSQFNKTIYFAVVFTWSGPKAVGMCLEDPRCNFNNLE
ncbi:hypothetical protein LSH36_1036g00002 [Paralvinella palmiformis]|uniref:Schlafen AlbA-2 domain-containing protein n=1 Tax=Paralvinella palmiformis TaxID=53620 RepID=A0AAD9IVM6_9ANNE|nr:hypothetical protein LSH36_1036g00002 [Paralvinella palmiformis]